MNLRSLRTLVEIDEVGSFAVAANHLGLTLSAVSLQMKALEADLQLALFDRTHRPPAMTPLARQVARNARTILAEVTRLRAIASEPGVLRGDYRIGFVGTASVRLMPRFLAKASREQPLARFLVESGLSSALAEKVRTGTLDAAVITATPDSRNDALFVPLQTEDFVVAMPERLQGCSLENCAAQLPLIQFTPTTGIGMLVADYLAERRVKATASLELDSVEAVMGCVNAGVGFAILPEPDAARYAKAVSLQRLDGKGLQRILGLAVGQAGPVAGQISALAELFQDATPSRQTGSSSKMKRTRRQG